MKRILKRWKNGIKNSRVCKRALATGKRLHWKIGRRRAEKQLSMTEKEAESILNAVYPKPAVRSRSARKQYESQMDVSVIIPAYNVQPYIRECLDSVVNQDLRTSWEVIVVDDGSDDGTEAILEEYKAYPQIRVIRQENGGLSSARNTGLINAQGKHLLFLDGDDALADGCLSVLMETNSTPRSPESTMRLTALLPPPPQPTTLMDA